MKRIVLLLYSLRDRLFAALVGLLLLWAYVARPDLLYHSLEHFLYDSLVSLAPPVQAEPRIVIVDIDEKSLASLGAWPWPRDTVASMVTALTSRHQVALLGLDIVFPLARPGDTELREALAHPAVVMSQTLDFVPRSVNRVGTLGGSVRVTGREHAPDAAGFVANAGRLLSGDAAVGHISPIIDDDGRVRRLYPLACVGDRCSLSLALRMYAQLAGEPDALRADYLDRGRMLRLVLGQAEPLALPLDSERALVVPYRVAAGGFPVVSVADVLDSPAGLPILDNALVLVGSSALGIGDRVATPLDKLAPGVEVHAQLLSAVLDQRLIRPLPVSAPPFLLGVAIVVLSWLLWPRGTRYAALLWPVAALAGTALVLSWLLLEGDLWLPLSPLPVLVVAVAGTHLLRQNLAFADRLRHLRSRFSEFLPNMVVGRLIDAQDVGPETELRTMTVLIADIRGFTSASEGKTPAQVAEFAQRCFEVLSAEVARHGGIIEKYTGDGLVALWGVPVGPGGDSDGAAPAAPLRVQPASGPDAAYEHARWAARAVSAAIAMQEGIEQLGDWFTERGYGRPKLSIGLNTGPMSVGVYGSHSHYAWSAQGQAFNVASRIERLTRQVGTHLLMGAATAQLLVAGSAREVGEYAVDSLSERVRVFTV